MRIVRMQAMLDLDGSNRLTYEQFVEVCRQCVEVEAVTTSDMVAGAGGGFTPEVAAALRRLSNAITRDKAAAVQLFRAVGCIPGFGPAVGQQMGTDHLTT